MLYKLRLADGTELDCDWCGSGGGVVMANLPGETDILRVAQIFSDPEKTRQITFAAGSETEYCGYTRLRYIQREAWPTGGILVGLEQGANEHE